MFLDVGKFITKNQNQNLAIKKHIWEKVFFCYGNFRFEFTQPLNSEIINVTKIF